MKSKFDALVNVAHKRLRLLEKNSRPQTASSSSSSSKHASRPKSASSSPKTQTNKVPTLDDLITEAVVTEHFSKQKEAVKEAILQNANDDLNSLWIYYEYETAFKQGIRYARIHKLTKQVQWLCKHKHTHTGCANTQTAFESTSKGVWKDPSEFKKGEVAMMVCNYCKGLKK